jgi:hydroxymethylglutaryl-CoA lyase
MKYVLVGKASIKLCDTLLRTGKSLGDSPATSLTMDTVNIVEVGPRDGLQSIATTVPIHVKLELIRRLKDAGLRSIELTSVVSPKAIPQLQDCRQVMSSPLVQDTLQHQPNLRLPVLVPNEKGLRVATEHGIKEIAVFVSATEGFSRANIKCSVAEGLERAKRVATAAKSNGMAVRG